MLGIIPKEEALGRTHRGVRGDLGRAAEAFRQLRTNLRFVDVDNEPRKIVVTSALAGEGKSTVSSNVARLVAQAGTPVLLIDADLRRPMIATTFEIDGAVGLTQALAGDVEVKDVIIESGMPNLSLLPAGRIPPNPSELLGSLRMKQLIDDLSLDYLVILDAPPLLPVTDAGLLSAFCDGALLVQATGKTQIEQSQHCRRILDQVGSRLLGVVLNKAPVKGATPSPTAVATAATAATAGATSPSTRRATPTPPRAGPPPQGGQGDGRRRHGAGSPSREGRAGQKASES